MKRKRPRFASDEVVAATRLLDDYDLKRPWKVLGGSAGQAAIDAAGAMVEVVGIDKEDAVLADKIVVDANGACFVFVRE